MTDQYNFDFITVGICRGHTETLLCTTICQNSRLMLDNVPIKTSCLMSITLMVPNQCQFIVVY